MKVSQFSKCVASVFGFIFLACLTAPVAYGDFTFGEPVSIETGISVIDPAHESIDCISSNGLEIYIGSDRPGGQGGYDLWVLTRDSISEDWGPPENLGPAVNSPQDDAHVSLSVDGLVLYFTSDRLGGSGSWDIYMTTRATKDDPWGQAVNMGTTINSGSTDISPWISQDGLELYFVSQRPGGYGNDDIWLARRATTNTPWDSPLNLGPSLNSADIDGGISLSPDGLLLLFDSRRPGGHGGYDMWAARRLSVNAPWQSPVNLGPIVNGPLADGIPRLSPDGSTLYFTTQSGDTFDNWQVPILPIVDFNGDEFVDCADVCFMIDQWGTDDPRCDIGPMPWGDGIVDAKDLLVLAEHILKKIHIDENDNGSQVELEQGQVLIITLESNPTTGYGWELSESQESILQQMGEAEYKPSETGDQPLVGAGGWEIFRFKAISAGQMPLKLIYRRSWEEGVEPLKTFSIDVVVH